MIELQGVSRTVPSGDAMLTILHPLDLASTPGRVVAITGPSGSGKSTLLGLLAGLDAPSTGRILIDGVRHHRDVGGRAGAVSRHAHRLRLSVLPPAAVADRAGERARPARDCRRAPMPARRADALLTEVGLGAAAPSLSVAALGRRAAARRHRARAGQRSARFCWPTSRPAISIAGPAIRSSTS